MRKGIIILVAALLAAWLPANAQADADTTASAIAGNGGYSAKRLQMQSRYITPDQDEFTHREFFSNMSGGVSFDYIYPIKPGFMFGPYASFYVGKQFAKASTVRISLGAGLFYNTYSGDYQLKYHLVADYLFNFSSFFNGYSKYRLCEFSALGGLGYYRTRLSNYPQRDLTVRTGLNINFHVLKHADLFLEPRLDFFREKSGSIKDNTDAWRHYSMSAVLAAGISFKAVDRLRWKEEPAIGWYALAMGGPQYQNSAQVYSIGVGKMMGGTGAAGIGLHYMKWLDFRISFTYSKNGWSTDFYGKRKNTSYDALRFEGLFDIANMITGRDDTRLSGGFVFGPEIGVIRKASDVTGINDIKYWYFGAGAGLQGKYRVNDKVRLFVEPRVSFVPYLENPYNGSPVRYGKDCDITLSLNVGFEYHFKRYK